MRNRKRLMSWSRRRGALVTMGTIALSITALAASSVPASAAPPAEPGDAQARVIVQTAPGVDAAAVARDAVADHGQGRGRTLYVYGAAVNGFAAELPAASLAALQHNPTVVSIEPDAPVTASTTESPTPSWGLDRIDQHPLPLDASYSYSTKGAGVKAYIVDTGVNSTSVDFTGRIAVGYSAIGGTSEDCNGHGTHVAGTVGGTTYGVAKAVTIVPVRVLDCNGSGSVSGVVAGINWAITDHVSGPAVLNMSLGGGASSTLDAAVASATADGITVAVAAGNSNADACNSSPARAASAITVGATTSTDARASYSNFGTCLDIFAPGSSITSDWIGSNTATNTISGTSMATPHVTGAAARYLEANPDASPTDVDNALTVAATTNTVTSPGTGSPNLLLFVDGGAASPPPAPTAPAAPGSVTATAANASAAVSWTTPTDGGSPITGYALTTYRASDNVALSTANLGVVTSTTVGGLTNGTGYYFRVAAVNTIGTGPSTPSNTVTPAMVPSAPLSVNATGARRAMNLTWSVPTANGGSAITGYRILVYRASTDQLDRTITVGTITSATVTNLVKGRSYYAVVNAVNAIGNGPGTRSNTVTVS